jgi:hypothetical protein
MSQKYRKLARSSVPGPDGPQAEFREFLRLSGVPFADIPPDPNDQCIQGGVTYRIPEWWDADRRAAFGRELRRRFVRGRVPKRVREELESAGWEVMRRRRRKAAVVN